MNRLFTLICIVAGGFLLSCSGSKNLAESTAQKTTSTERAYLQQIVEGAQKSSFVTARIRMDVNTAGNSISANGTLRMKRNDVIQLSLNVLGFEVGRLEFTPFDVLIIDRFNKQYVRASYHEVSFLRQAGLDFYTLQALFWNELFVPGERSVNSALHRFQIQQKEEHILLALTDAPQLNYEFLTTPKTAHIQQVNVSRKMASATEKFEWIYDKFTDLNGKSFPGEMKCSIKAAGKTAGFTLNLSRLENNDDWETRTTVSSKYQKRNADDLLKHLLSL